MHPRVAVPVGHKQVAAGADDQIGRQVKRRPAFRADRSIVESVGSGVGGLAARPDRADELSLVGELPDGVSQIVDQVQRVPCADRDAVRSHKQSLAPATNE